MPLSLLHPVVAAWFERRFGAPTEAQRRGWPAIARGDDTLIAAPTGSGKTLAAFLWCIDRLLRRSLDGALTDETEVLYVSPLRALSADVERNLQRPLEELDAELAARLRGEHRLRVAVRTGDTPAAERERIRRRPPHVLITTPESLYILLTAARSREALGRVKTVIVDEIHALAGTKRGAHLALTLERLEAVVARAGGARPTRIGLSATQRPIDEVARFLVGSARVDAAGHPACEVVDVGQRRALDLRVEVPERDELSSVAMHEQWAEVFDRVADLVRAHQATLVFCNTRRLVERATHALSERLGEEAVAAHHGSLARKTRHAAEQRLKANRVKAVVATASLELGIDVGAVDLVVQLDSPRSLSVLVQRVGRSGHWLGGVPKGRLFALTRDALVECAALVRAARAGELDRVTVRRHPLDVLAQQLVAECAAAEWSVDELFALVRRAWPYAALERREFDQVLDMAASGVSARRTRASAWLHLDAVNGRVKGRRGARLAAITSGGAIPDNADYAVVAEPEGLRVGTVDEDFAVESTRGGIFLLGNTSWRVLRVEAGTVRVEDAHGAPPTIPFWNGEAPGRSAEASAAVSELRASLERRLVDGDAEGAAAWLEAECGVGDAGARQLLAYLAAGRAALGAVPTQDTVIAERFFDEAGGMQLVLHAPFGSRVNRAWGLALRKKFCRSFNFELQAAATDDGIVISLGPHHSFPLETVFHFVPSARLEETLTQALLGAPIFPTRWRWTAGRSLAVLRSRAGKKVPPQLQRMRAEDLLAAVFPDQAACPENLGGGDIELPDHPLVKETIRDCLCEPMDAAGVTALLARIERGGLTLRACDTAEPSVFAHAILNAAPYAYLDDAPLEERRTRAVMTRRTLPTAPGDLVALDATAIAEAIGDAWPPLRDADELHDALLGLTVLPAALAGASATHLPALVAAGRAAQLAAGTLTAWVAAERVAVVRAAYPDAQLAPALRAPTLLAPTVDAASPEAARLAIVRGWMEVAGPTTAAALGERLGLDTGAVDIALAQLESEGQVLRGRFSPGAAAGVLEWCDRRLLARIHHLTIGRLRREIAPVSAADLVRFLCRWQHVAPGTQLAGARGLAEAIGQLQGFEAAAGAWERDLLPRRVARYEPAWLDELCWRGEVAWGRLSPRRAEASTAAAPASGSAAPPTALAIGAAAPPTALAIGSATPPAALAIGAAAARAPVTTRAAPISLVRRSDLPWLLERRPPVDEAAARDALGDAARSVLDHLAARGASFFDDLVRACHRAPGDVVAALGELVACGLVTGDSFAALRSLFGSTRAASPGTARRRVWWRHHDDTVEHATGRWSVLTPATPSSSAASDTGDADDAPPADAIWTERARQLLRRYGVVFRDLLERERVPWRELLPIYRRLEARGELRGGRFVSGFMGEQFALPEAVEALRQARRTVDDAIPRAARAPAAPPAELVVIAATDPLNLVGIVTPGPRVPAVSGNAILFRDGVPVASREGGRLVIRATPDGFDADVATRWLEVPFPPSAIPSMGVAAPRTAHTSEA